MILDFHGNINYGELLIQKDQLIPNIPIYQNYFDEMVSDNVYTMKGNEGMSMYVSDLKKKNIENLIVMVCWSAFDFELYEGGAIVHDNLCQTFMDVMPGIENTYGFDWSCGMLKTTSEIIYVASSIEEFKCIRTMTEYELDKYLKSSVSLDMQNEILYYRFVTQLGNEVQGLIHYCRNGQRVIVNSTEFDDDIEDSVASYTVHDPYILELLKNKG